MVGRWRDYMFGGFQVSIHEGREIVRRRPDAAERRASKLLRSHLGKTQKKSLRNRGWFYAKGSHTKRRYRIYGSFATQNIECVDTGREYCAILRKWASIPTSDHVLAQKLAIETNEKKFLRTAVRVG